MPVTIQNKTNRRVLLRYNSGANQYLGPHEKCEIEEVEVKGKGSDNSPYNMRIKHLIDKNVVVVDTPVKKATKSPARKKKAKRVTSQRSAKKS